MEKTSFMPPQGQMQSQNSFLPSDNKEGEAQQMFESAFKDKAYQTFQMKFPELSSDIVTFKIIESDLDTGMAIGAFILQYRMENLYVPVVLFEDNLKPIEIMYAKRLDKFLPLKKEWLDLLLSNNVCGMGSAVKRPDTLNNDIDIRRLVSPPLEGRFGYAADATSELSFVDLLENGSEQVKQAFVSLMEKRHDFLKFAFENFDQTRLLNSMRKIAAEKKKKDTSVAGDTELVVVDNATPSKEVKDVFGDKATEAQKTIAKDGFTFKDNRKNTASAFSTESMLTLERATKPGTYKVYLTDGTSDNALVLPLNEARVSGYSHNLCGAHAQQCCSLTILPNGDYYEGAGVTSPINTDEFSGKVKDIVYGDKKASPKVGDTILFIRHDDTNFDVYGPVRVDEIVSKGDSKQFIERHGKKITYQNSAAKKIVRTGSWNDQAVIPHNYKILVLGTKKESYELVRDEKLAMSYINNKLLASGARQVKVANVGGDQFSIDGGFGLQRKEAFAKLATTCGIKASDSLAILEKLSCSGNHTTFFVVDHETQTKFGSIFGMAEGSQMQPGQVQQMMQGEMPQNPMMAGMDPNMMAQMQPQGGQMDPSQMPQGQPGMDPNMMGQMGPAGDPQTQQMSSSLMENALQLKNPELFDVGAVSSLANTVSVKDLLAVYIPHLEKALDSIGRILLTLWMQGQKVKDDLGGDNHALIEDKLRNIFNTLGEIILKLGKNSLLLSEKSR